MIMKWLNAILSLVIVERCVLCRLPAKGGICAECFVALPHPPVSPCARCGDPLLLPSCPCETAALPFDRVSAVGFYEGRLKEAIGAFKYGGRAGLAEPLGLLLAAYYREILCWTAPQAIVPVPLHDEVLRRRGFNQALLLARVAGRELRLPVWPSFLVKARPTRDQSTLTARERAENVAGAFAARGECGGRHLLLVDDVFTTGATAGEASRVLKAHGAATVSILTLARSRLRVDGRDVSEPLAMGRNPSGAAGGM